MEFTFAAMVQVLGARWLHTHIAYGMATTTDWSGIGFNYTQFSPSSLQRMDGMDENDWRTRGQTTVAIDQIQHFAGPTIRHSNHQTSYRRKRTTLEVFQLASQFE